jgi:hypothetical protein
MLLWVYSTRMRLLQGAFIPLSSYGAYSRKIWSSPLLLLLMSRTASANSRQTQPMPSPCAVAPCRNVRSSAANQAAPVRKTPRLVTVLTTASRMPWEARRARASLRWSRPTLSSIRSMPAVSFAAMWMRCGRRARNGPTINWQSPRAPRRSLKKGAPNEPPKRNRPGNQNAFRPSGRRRSGFGSAGDSSTTAGSATGRAGAGTTAERRHHRSCWSGTALLVRRAGPVSWPPREDL